jgi:TRAP-type C4-dicarboxylate transport system permease small subunit
MSDLRKPVPDPRGTIQRNYPLPVPDQTDNFSTDEDINAEMPEGLAEKVGRWCVHAVVAGLVVMMGVEMLLRTVFGVSLQVSNEVGGYALVAISFLSLASGQTLHAYHRVQFLDRWLSRSGKAWLKIVFDGLSLLVALVLLMEFVRFERLTWASGDVAATSLMTPLWIPRAAMVIGMLGLAWALLRTLWRDIRQLGHFGCPNDKNH